MSQPKSETNDTTNLPIEVDNFDLNSLEVIWDGNDEEIDLESLEEPTSGTLDILNRIETFDDYFHSCGRW
ncbi:hypothetical protein ACE1CI_19640 [Aerosakkonemataceae cyanobacterium BLCC-F50]|uniref:Uncharacterized protein n=2 Tax=Floridanema TaxID=3396149 RepID=A0ABV4XTX2_9CYAN